MPTRKIADAPVVCYDPDHLPPMFKVFEPGVYEHTCPACGLKTLFRVDSVHGMNWTLDRSNLIVQFPTSGEATT